MNFALREPMTREAFFAWAEAQEGRYEFDGLRPVAMTGGNLGHSCLIGNINRHLGNRLAGKPCRPMGPEAGVATIGDTVRYPDAVVTCSKIQRQGPSGAKPGHRIRGRQPNLGSHGPRDQAA